MLNIQLRCCAIVQGGKLSGSIQVGDNRGCRTPCQGNSMTQAVLQSRCKTIQASKANAVPDCLSDLGLTLDF